MTFSSSAVGAQLQPVSPDQGENLPIGVWIAAREKAREDSLETAIAAPDDPEVVRMCTSYGQSNHPSL
jgi:hypothetical protein